MRFKPFFRARPSASTRRTSRRQTQTSVSSLRQCGHNRVAEGREVVWETRRDQVSVHDAVLVDPVGTGVDAIVPHARVRRHSASLDDARADRHPRRVADRCNDLAGVVHRPDESQDLLVLAHPVRACDPSGDDDGVEILRLQVGRFHVDFARIRVFRTVDPLLVPRKDDLGPFLNQPIVRDPEFEVLVAVFGEHDNLPPFERHEGGKAVRGEMPSVERDGPSSDPPRPARLPAFGIPWECLSPVTRSEFRAWAEARMIASTMWRPSRIFKSAACSATAASTLMTEVRDLMNRMRSAGSCPSRRYLARISARQTAGVNRTSLPSSNALISAPAREPRKYSTHAQESMVFMGVTFVPQGFRVQPRIRAEKRFLGAEQALRQDLIDCIRKPPGPDFPQKVILHVLSQEDRRLHRHDVYVNVYVYIYILWRDRDGQPRDRIGIDGPEAISPVTASHVRIRGRDRDVEGQLRVRPRTPPGSGLDVAEHEHAPGPSCYSGRDPAERRRTRVQPLSTEGGSSRPRGGDPGGSRSRGLRRALDERRNRGGIHRHAVVPRSRKRGPLHGPVVPSDP